MVHFQADGYNTINASITVSDAAKAIDFYSSLFGATERMRFDEPDGKVGHCELQVGDSVLMINDPYPDIGAIVPAGGGASVHLVVYVPDVDKTVRDAVRVGATEIRPASDEFYGDRVAVIECPWGHRWSLMTHIEDVSPEEMQRRAAEYDG